ncbi:MAG TPA: hypothetical protein VF018_04770 [Acidobacteriaceae bacterium]
MQVAWRRTPQFNLTATLPQGMQAEIRLPATDTSRGIWKDGRPAPAHREGPWWVLNENVTGKVSLEVR